MLSLADTVNTKGCITVTNTESFLLQPSAFVPVTKYCTVCNGVATGLLQVAQLKEVASSQVNVALPFTLKLVDVPLQIVTSGPAKTVGVVFTEIAAMTVS